MRVSSNLMLRFYISALIAFILIGSAFSDFDSFKPLQVNVLINGHEVSAIVDTGAEVSVMSLKCANECQLMDYVDTQQAGMAIGIGATEIIGRTNDLQMLLGKTVSVHNKISVLKQSKCDFILGLDFLKKYNCDISVKQNLLNLSINKRDVIIPLLQDNSQIPDASIISKGINLECKRNIDHEDEDESEYCNEEPVSMAGV